MGSSGCRGFIDMLGLASRQASTPLRCVSSRVGAFSSRSPAPEPRSEDAAMALHVDIVTLSGNRSKHSFDPQETLGEARRIIAKSFKDVCPYGVRLLAGTTILTNDAASLDAVLACVPRQADGTVVVTALCIGPDDPESIAIRRIIRYLERVSHGETVHVHDIENAVSPGRVSECLMLHGSMPLAGHHLAAALGFFFRAFKISSCIGTAVLRHPQVIDHLERLGCSRELTAVAACREQHSCEYLKQNPLGEVALFEQHIHHAFRGTRILDERDVILLASALPVARHGMARYRTEEATLKAVTYAALTRGRLRGCSHLLLAQLRQLGHSPRLQPALDVTQAVAEMQFAELIRAGRVLAPGAHPCQSASQDLVTAYTTMSLSHAWTQALVPASPPGWRLEGSRLAPTRRLAAKTAPPRWPKKTVKSGALKRA